MLGAEQLIAKELMCAELRQTVADVEMASTITSHSPMYLVICPCRCQKVSVTEVLEDFL